MCCTSAELSTFQAISRTYAAVVVPAAADEARAVACSVTDLMFIYRPLSRLINDSSVDWKFEQAFTGETKPKCIYIYIHIYINLLGRYTGISQQLAR